MRSAGNMVILEKVFKAAAGFLEEGSLEARTYGKRILWEIRRLTSSLGGDEFRRMMSRLAGGEL